MTAPEPYRVEAYNTARDSENKIHDDLVARRFGFGGGLVPGVDVYAYMMHLAVARWGRAWLERGSATCRFHKPVYDGQIATVTGTETAEGTLELHVESQGTLCATGTAALAATPPAMPAVDGFAASAANAERPAADERSLAVGTLLAIRPLPLTDAFVSQYLRDLREADPLYAREGLAHPGTILRCCNWALSHNVALGPWIHVGSAVQNFAAARLGDELSVRSRVTANYEHKGHRFVELDALVLGNGVTQIARIAHTAIYRPRQVAAA